MALLWHSIMIFFVRSTHTHCYMMPFLLHHLETVLPTTFRNYSDCLEHMYYSTVCTNYDEAFFGKKLA